MNIDTMPAGREMDALVAEKVMGYKVPDEYRHFTDYDGGPPMIVSEYTWKTPWDGVEHPGILYDNIPHYSTDIAAAWEVLDKLIVQEYEVHLTVFSDGSGAACDIFEDRADKYPGGKNYPGNTWELCADGNGDTVPHAISRAALKAIENRLDNHDQRRYTT